MIDWVSTIGYIAALLVASTFCMTTMLTLRCFAIASNFCFIIYAYYHSPTLYPVLILHGFLLPLNSYRLFDLFKENSQEKFDYRYISKIYGRISSIK
jgi:hydroxyacyl-ACP dehydratase HTD2-like protein with hotdog domain